MSWAYTSRPRSASSSYSRDHGLVEQTTGRGKYRLGFGVVRLAGSAAAQLDLAQESQAACEELVAAVGETANVAILDEGWATNVSEVRGEAAVVSQSWVGRRTPLHATSSGKVLLAFQPKDDRERVLARPLEQFTTQTIVEPDLLRVELAQIRERGWASTCEELEVGLNAVAAPIRGADGTVVAAVSVSGPSYRLGAALLRRGRRLRTGGGDADKPAPRARRLALRGPGLGISLCDTQPDA